MTLGNRLKTLPVETLDHKLADLEAKAFVDTLTERLAVVEILLGFIYDRIQ